MKTVKEVLLEIGYALRLVFAWIGVQIKTKSWRRHAGLLLVVIPLLMQKFGVAPEAIDQISKVLMILTGGITDDGTIGTTIVGVMFYGYGWLKRKKAAV